MSQLAQTVQLALMEAIERDALVLPTLPEVALRIREAIEDPEISSHALAKVLSTDTALAARMIKLVNSPLLRASTEITDLSAAVARLGINYTCNLATGLAMEQMFQATTDVVDQKMRQVWAKSTEVAGICHALSRHYTKLPPDQATMAGLMHLIGVLPILTYAEDNPGLLADEHSLELVIEKIHPILGEKILRTWDFPEAIAKVPGAYQDFARQAERADYVDLVQVATLQSYVGTNHPYTQLDWSTVGAFARLGIDPSQSMTDDEDLSASMDAAMAMLQ